MNGKLIVIEGLDGSGKATQTSLLCEKYSNREIMFRRLSFPNYESPSSALVKMYLGGEFSKTPEGVNPYAASVFYAADRCAGYLKDWKKDYEKGMIFVADRYTTSNEIYQMSKLPFGQWDEFLDWTEDFEYRKLGIPKPDKVVYLDMSVEVSQRLMSARYGGDESKKDIHESSVEFLKHCREAALYAAGKLSWSVIRCDDGETARGIAEISEEIEKAVGDIVFG